MVQSAEVTKNNQTTLDSHTPKSVVLIHWLLASMVFFLFVSSWWMLSLPLPSEEFTYRELPFQLHKNIGLSLFVLAIYMASVRIFSSLNRANQTKTWMQKMVIWDHFLIYFLLAAACLSGYISSSYSGWQTTVWWLFQIPAWTGENDELNIVFSEIHLWSCWALLAVLMLHIVAAIYHGFNNDGLIEKMFRLR